MKEFTAEAFATHLNELADNLPLLQTEMLEVIGIAVETAAKEKIGEYQGTAGPFAAWQDLAQSTKEDRVRAGYPENEPGLREGDMRESIQHTVTPPAIVQIGSDDEHLVFFEFGTVKQPPRSVLGAAAFQQAPWLVSELGASMELYLAGEKKVK